jgi:MoxR-like ATPase
LPSPIQTPEELKIVEQLAQARQLLMTEIHKAIVGQDEVIEEILLAMFSRGHCLMVGVPGLAKTLLVSTIANVLKLNFSRIQFTPDLMPSDITGTDVIEENRTTGERNFRFIRGPIFSNILLADEINRTPPKTQAALLQAMQEYHVTTGGNTYPLELPFFVLATQNPIEQEGTYPLPEAQLDRFLFNTVLDYLTADQEMQVVDLTTTTHVATASAVTSAQEILDFQQLVRMVPIGESVARHAVDMVRVSRPGDDTAPDFVKKYVNYGASVRAAQFLVLSAKARSLMRGRYCVNYEDIRAMYIPVLRHRILLNFHAESDRLKQDDILKRVLEWKPAPRD